MLSAADLERMRVEDQRQRARSDDLELLRRGIVVERKFNPDEPRIPGGPHGGEWGSSGGVGKALKDALKLGDKADLGSGEKLIGSDKVSAESGAIRMALVDHGGHKSLRLGIGGYGFGSRDDEGGPWRAGPDRTAEINAERKKLSDEKDALEHELESAGPDRKAAIEKRLDELDNMDVHEVSPGGYTANIDQAAAGRLHSELSKALADAVRKSDEVNDYFDDIDRLKAEYAIHDNDPAIGEKLQKLKAHPPTESGGTHGDYFSAEGTIPGQWADVHYVVSVDDPSLGAQVTLGAVPHSSGRDLNDLHGYEQAADLDPAETKKFLKLLAQYAGHN